ncbi:MAG: hypothetical protein O6951_03465 [Actinobacteria bacterium]|nr:hypothetical protein [Actinomycetota bacterium]
MNSRRPADVSGWSRRWIQGEILNLQAHRRAHHLDEQLGTPYEGGDRVMVALGTDVRKRSHTVVAVDEAGVEIGSLTVAAG